MADPDNSSYTVKEMISLIVIPALEDIKKQAVSREQVVDRKIAALESWRNRMVGAMFLITALLIPISIPVVITVLGAHH